MHHRKDDDSLTKRPFLQQQGSPTFFFETLETTSFAIKKAFEECVVRVVAQNVVQQQPPWRRNPRDAHGGVRPTKRDSWTRPQDDKKSFTANLESGLRLYISQSQPHQLL